MPPDASGHYLNKDGLYRVQHQLLMCVYKYPDASQKELARIQNVSTAAVAVTLKKLEKGGYVGRIVDRDDNRYNKIRITEKGRKEVERSIDFLSGWKRECSQAFLLRKRSAFTAVSRSFPEISSRCSSRQKRRIGTDMKRYKKYITPYLALFSWAPS